MKPNIHFHLVDLKTLMEAIEKRHRSGTKLNRRMEEIWSACIFALCFENGESQRFLIGFPGRGEKAPVVTLEQILSGAVGELDDWDVVLVPDFGPDRMEERKIHQCQLVSYRRRSNPGTQDIIDFLEEKKLKYSAGGDLRLVVTLDQETSYQFDWVAIAGHLMMRRPKCPYQQVFMISLSGTRENPSWHCHQIFPAFLRYRISMFRRRRFLFRTDQPTRLAAV